MNLTVLQLKAMKSLGDEPHFLGSFKAAVVLNSLDQMVHKKAQIFREQPCELGWYRT